LPAQSKYRVDLRNIGTVRNETVTELRGRRAIVAHAELHFRRRAEQTMGMPAMQERLWTAAEVRDLPDVPGLQFEVIDGELFVTPSPSYAHQAVADSLCRAVSTYARSQGIGFALTGPGDVDVDERTLVQPDVFVIPPKSGKLPRDFAEAGRLILAIEVLSPHSVRRDRVRKRELYARMGAEYWIVDHQARSVERFSPHEAVGLTTTDRLEWHPENASSPLVLDLTRLFREALGD
jgi:Uma2 family endonuclease